MDFEPEDIRFDEECIYDHGLYGARRDECQYERYLAGYRRYGGLSCRKEFDVGRTNYLLTKI